MSTAQSTRKFHLVDLEPSEVSIEMQHISRYMLPSVLCQHEKISLNWVRWHEQSTVWLGMSKIATKPYFLANE